MSDISEATGLGRASLYHHFPGGKSEMAVAAVQCLQAYGEQNMFAQMVGREPAGALRHLLDRFDSYFEGGNTRCLLVMLHGRTGSPEVDEKIQTMSQMLLDLTAAQYAGFGLNALDARDKAEQFFVTLHGAVAVARSVDDNAPFERAIRRLRTEVDDLEQRD